MSDRELLERAAKAAGIAGKWGREGYIEQREGFIPTGWRRAWNPLDDSTDALELAVTLGLHIITHGHADGDAAIVIHKWAEAVEEHGDDPAAATRRAIVSVAARIGELRAASLAGGETP